MKQYLLESSAFLIKLLSAAWLILLPVHSSIIATTILILADFVLGVSASVKEKKPITSTGFRRTLIKLIGYVVGILGAFLLEQYFLDGLPIVKVLVGFVGLTEGKSFFENLKRLTGIDLWAQFVAKLNMNDLKNVKLDDGDEK